jgi:hypothetical protein
VATPNLAVPATLSDALSLPTFPTILEFRPQSGTRAESEDLKPLFKLPCTDYEVIDIPSIFDADVSLERTEEEKGTKRWWMRVWKMNDSRHNNWNEEYGGGAD